MLTLYNVTLFFLFLKNVGFHKPGTLRLCTSPERMDEAKYQMQRQGWHKAPQWLVTPDEIAEMHPLLKMDNILGGMFNPGLSLFVKFCPPWNRFISGESQLVVWIELFTLCFRIVD